jgi:hypothetical protein
MSDGGMANGFQLAAIAHELRNVRGDAMPLGGDALVHSLERCIAVRTDRSAWDSVLGALVVASRDSVVSIQGEPSARAARTSTSRRSTRRVPTIARCFRGAPSAA